MVCSKSKVTKISEKKATQFSICFLYQYRNAIRKSKKNLRRKKHLFIYSLFFFQVDFVAQVRKQANKKSNDDDDNDAIDEDELDNDDDEDNDDEKQTGNDEEESHDDESEDQSLDNDEKEEEEEEEVVTPVNKKAKVTPGN